MGQTLEEAQSLVTLDDEMAQRSTFHSSSVNFTVEFLKPPWALQAGAYFMLLPKTTSGAELIYKIVITFLIITIPVIFFTRYQTLYQKELWCIILFNSH